MIATAVALGLRRVGRPTRLDTALTVSCTRPPTRTFGPCRALPARSPGAPRRDALDLLGFDEVVISMPQAREQRWLHLDLLRKIRALGVPVSQVINAALGVGKSSVHGSISPAREPDSRGSCSTRRSSTACSPCSWRERPAIDRITSRNGSSALSTTKTAQVRAACTAGRVERGALSEPVRRS